MLDDIIKTLTKHRDQIESWRMTRSLVEKRGEKDDEGEFWHRYEPGPDLRMIICFKRPKK